MKKSEMIESILNNSVYQANSGMRERLAKALQINVSRQDIAALKLIVEIKEGDARKSAARECGKLANLLH